MAVSPREWVNPSVRFWSEKYMKPQFSQGWGVFAPVPREKARLLYRFYENGVWSDVISMEDEMDKFINPLAERVALKSAYYLGVEVRESTLLEQDGTKNYRVVKNSEYYKRAGYTCLQNLKLTQGIRPDSIEIILERDLFPKPGNSVKKMVVDNFGAEYVK